MVDEEGVALLHHLPRLNVEWSVLASAAAAYCLLVEAGCTRSAALLPFSSWWWSGYVNYKQPDTFPLLTSMHKKLIYIPILMLTVVMLIVPVHAQPEGGYSVEWQRPLPGLSGTAVIQTSDGGYLALGEDASLNSNTAQYTNPHNIVVKTDSNGNLEWSKTVAYNEGNPLTRLSEVVEVNDGYILGGTVDSVFNSGTQHFCLIKIDAKGNELWKTLSPFEQPDVTYEATALTSTSNGGCFLVGSIYGAPPTIPYLIITLAQPNGQLEFSKALPVNGSQLWPWMTGISPWVTQTRDGGFLLINNQGQSHPISPSSTSLLKLDANGSFQWTQSYGGGGNFYHTGGACAVVLSDGYLIGGMAAPESSWTGGMIIRTDLEGKMLWNRTYPSLNQVYSALNSTQDGFLLLSTSTQPSDSKTTHILLLQTSSAGEIQAQTDLLTVNAYMFSHVSQLVSTKDGGAVFTGSFLYERSQEASGSTSDADKFWIAKISTPGHGDVISNSDQNLLALEVAIGVVVAAVATAVVVVILKIRKGKNRRPS